MIEPAARERIDNISRWFHEIWTEGREEIVNQLLPPEGVIHGLARQPLAGPAEFKKFVHAGRRSHREVSVAVGEIRAATRQATASLTVTTTHRRTGKRVTYRGAFLVNFTPEGQVNEAWFTADTSTAKFDSPATSPR